VPAVRTKLCRPRRSLPPRPARSRRTRARSGPHSSLATRSAPTVRQLRRCRRPRGRAKRVTGRSRHRRLRHSFIANMSPASAAIEQGRGGERHLVSGRRPAGLPDCPGWNSRPRPRAGGRGTISPRIARCVFVYTEYDIVSIAIALSAVMTQARSAYGRFGAPIALSVFASRKALADGR
jgi:hypothetical protein